MAFVWYGHFDNVDTANRRMLYALDLRRYFTAFLTDGVRNGGTELQVTAGDGLSVNVNKGMANVQGAMFGVFPDIHGDKLNVTVGAAHPQFPRWDRIVLRLSLDPLINGVVACVLQGDAGASPVPPTLTQTPGDYMLSLARVYVPAGSTAVGASNIVDERFNTELCGIMNSTMGLDPSVWQAQFDAFMASLLATSTQNQADLDKAFNDLKASFSVAFSAAQTSRDAQFNNWFTLAQGQTAPQLGLWFDFLADQPGNTVTTTFPAGYLSRKVIKAGTLTIATRDEAAIANGSTVATTIYAADGATVMLSAVTTKKFNADGTFTATTV